MLGGGGVEEGKKGGLFTGFSKIFQPSSEQEAQRLQENKNVTFFKAAISKL